MKKILAAIAMNAFWLAPALAERPRLDGREAPRATDLLRAERLAEQARKRLEMPRPHGGGWKRGGAGWGDDAGPEGHDRRDVIIDVNPPHKQRRPPQ
jgi:hypothetical protein